LNKELFFDNLSKFFSEGDLAKVEKYLLEEIAQIVADDGDDLSLCIVYNELGSHYRSTSRFGESLAAFDKATLCLERQGLGLSSTAATIMINRAGTYRLMGESKSAMMLYKHAQLILQSDPISDRYLIASLYNNLSLTYLQDGKLEDAMREAHKAFTIIKAIPNSEPEQVTSLINLGTIALQADDLATAETLMNQAMGIYKDTLSPDTHYAAALNLLANIRIRQAKFKDAISALQESLSFTQKFFGNNIEAAIAKQSLAQTYARVGDIKSACSWQQSAIKDLEQLLGLTDSQTISAGEEMNRYKEQLEGEEHESLGSKSDLF
jgi:tetratricopeptide (TPR) repeat protein